MSLTRQQKITARAYGLMYAANCRQETAEPLSRPTPAQRHQATQLYKCEACETAPVESRGDYCDECHAEREEFIAEQAYERSSAIHPSAR